MAFSISLLISDPCAEELMRFSQELGQATQSDVMLGTNSVPHITLIKTRANSSAMIDQRKLGDLLGATYSCEFRGLNLVPSRSTGRTWVEVSVVLTEELFELHRELAHRVDVHPRELECQMGFAWRPHVTVSRFLDPAPVTMPLPRGLLRRADVVSKVVTGRAGDTFVMG